MSLKLGTLDILDVKLGVTQVKSIYKGETLIWNNFVPIPMLMQTQAILDRADLLGFARPDGQKINVLINFLITSGMWAKMDIIFNFAYNNPLYNDFKRINWKNPSGSLLLVEGGIIQRPYGYEGDGISGYLNTQFNPAIGTNKYTLNNASRGIVVYKETNSFNAEGILDCANNRTYNCMYNGNTPFSKINVSFAPSSSSINFLLKGYKLIARDNSTAFRGTSVNGTQVITDPSVSLRNEPQTILGPIYFGKSGVSFYHMGESLPTTFYDDFRVAYNSYLATIGLSGNA